MAYITYIQGEPFSIQFTFYLKYSSGKNCRTSPKLQPGRQAGGQAVNRQLGCNIASKHACQAHCHTAKFVAPAAVALALAVALAVAVSCVCVRECVSPQAAPWWPRFSFLCNN